MHTMGAMRIAWAILVSTLVLVAAGCGGEDLGAGKASGAELLNPGALVYWETKSDPDSDQWQQVEELLGRFPDGEKWIAQLKQELQTEGVSWEDDIKPALGDQTVAAVYAKSMADVSFVGMTNSKDPDKTVALVQKLNAADEGEDVITRVVGDWVVLSTEESWIDAALKGDGGQSLADADGFEEGTAKLPDDALTRVYVDVAGALESFGSAQPQSAQAFRLLGLNEVDFAGAWAKARDDGVEIAGALQGEGADKLLGAAKPYKSALLDLVPADAFTFLSFQGQDTTEQFDALRNNPLYGMAVREFEREVGVKLEDIVQLFSGEVGFYAAPAAPVPELTLLLASADPARARQSAERLLRTLAERGGGKVADEGDVTTALFEGFAINLATVENTVVVTTVKGAIEELKGSGDKLSDTDRYKEALEAAGVPDEYTGLVYVDLAEAIKLAMGFATSSGEAIPAEVSRNLAPLRSLVAYGEKDGELGKALLFVEIE